MLQFFNFLSDNYKNHFQCNLQECDCFYELNEFEENILKLNARKEMCWNKPVRAPHCGPLTLKKLENSKPLGAKLLVLNKKFNTVNFQITVINVNLSINLHRQ